MTERDILGSWSLGRATSRGKTTRLDQSQNFGEAQESGEPTTGSTSKSEIHGRSPTPNEQENLFYSAPERDQTRLYKKTPPAPPAIFKIVQPQKEINSEKLTINDQPPETVVPSQKMGKLPRWAKSWVLWTIMLALIPSTVGFLSMAILLKLPSAPNCPSIFWPLASASVRLHCAQLAASKQTVNDLLQAIALVNQLPQSHPLRGEVDRLLEQWSQDILQIADESFQAGKLEEAIAIARKLPEDMSAYKVVAEKIADWQSTWSQAVGFYQQAEAEMREQHWHQAFMSAAKLLNVGNKFWATTKYDQLNALITTAQEDGNKLAKAENLSNSGVVENLLQALKLAESIGQESYVYQKAQEAIPVFGRKMLELAQKKLDQKNAEEALDIARQIPPNARLELETQDFITLAAAQQSAWAASIPDIETAIAQAQQIDPSRPMYEQAQELIARWQLEIEDVARLDKARTLASQGSINYLAAAIAEAQLIPTSNPRAEEAKKEMNGWIAQVQTIQDKPYLDRAEQLAVLEDVNSLRAAIAEASQISRDRALYPEALGRIRDWTEKIQRIEDRPFLDQAREMASSGNLPGAIATARQITRGRALSSEAQTAINDWQGLINARENWKQAKEMAARGTPEALAEAMRLADRVPTRSILRNDANAAMEEWGQQLLQIARSQGESNIPMAIETARLIPRGTAAYSLAQEQMRAWKQLLSPQPQQTQQFQPAITNPQ